MEKEGSSTTDDDSVSRSSKTKSSNFTKHCDDQSMRTKAATATKESCIIDAPSTSLTCTAPSTNSCISTNTDQDDESSNETKSNCCKPPPSLERQQDIQNYHRVTASATPGAFAVDGINPSIIRLQRNNNDTNDDNNDECNESNDVEQPRTMVHHALAATSTVPHIYVSSAAELHPANDQQRQCVNALLVEIVDDNQQEEDMLNKIHQKQQRFIFILLLVSTFVVTVVLVAVAAYLITTKSKSSPFLPSPNLPPSPPPIYSLLLGWTCTGNLTGLHNNNSKHTDNKENFGYSVSMSGDGLRMAVGAPGWTIINDDEDGSYNATTAATTSTGQVQVLEWNGTKWNLLMRQQQQPLVGPRPSLDSIMFGSVVRLSRNGQRVAVASISSNRAKSRLQVYHQQQTVTDTEHNSPNNNNSWIALGNEIEYVNATDSTFDLAVDLSFDGTIMVVGNANVKNNRGQVRVYREVKNTASSSSSWVVMGSVIRGTFRSEQCGRSVSISANGTRIAVGSVGNSQPQASVSGRTGNVRLFDWSEERSDWILVGEINGQHPQDAFGAAVSLSDDGTVVAIGAYGNTLRATAGMAQVYRCQDINSQLTATAMTWSQVGQTLVGTNSSDALGYSVALSADGFVLAVGVPGSDTFGNGAGSVIVYRYEEKEEHTPTWIRHGSELGSGGGGGGSGEYGSFGFSVSLSADGSRVAGGAPHFSSIIGASDEIGLVRVFDVMDE